VNVLDVGYFSAWTLWFEFLRAFTHTAGYAPAQWELPAGREASANR